MEPNLAELRKNYENFDNQKIIRIATEEADRLRPEALELLKDIIKERGLSDNVLKGVDAQFEPIDENKLTAYTELLRNLPCPVCHQTQDKLNATVVSTVFSLIFFTYYKSEVKIACPSCLDKLNNNAMVKSALLGWWGLPWGLFRTPKALIANSKRKKSNNLYEANDILKAFTLPRIGRIEANKNNKEQLEDLITFIR